MGVEAARLLRKARQGDGTALGRLQEEYTTGWLRRFHPDVALRIQRLDAKRLLGSSMAEVMASAPMLESGPVFFTWVTFLIRFKLAISHLWSRRSRSPAEREGETDLAALEAYVQTVQAILDSFPGHPVEMAAASLKLLDGLSIEQIGERLGDRPARLYAKLQEGARRLQSCLTS